LSKSQPPAPVALDDLDRALLHAVATDGEVTNKELAAQLGIAESTCAYRRRLLRERGVIGRARTVVDPAALGFPLQAVVTVRLGSHSKELVEDFYDAIVRTPRVLQVFHVAGSADFLVHVAVESPEMLRDMVLEHITVHRGVRQTETQLAFDVRQGVGVTGPET
jgi:DNA-binding Lrp family transcriptional regulator